MTTKKHFFHLNKEFRDIIEQMLNEGKNYTEIAKAIHKSPTTISREISKHTFKKYTNAYETYARSFCKKKLNCKSKNCSKSNSCFEEDICEKLIKSPHVCNPCSKKAGCRKVKHYYYSKFANEKYRKTLSNSRAGIDLSKEEVYEIDKLISPLIKKQKQSISHIYINHPDELSFSKSTLYSYINLGIFSVKDYNLQRKLKYKPRKKGEKQRVRRETAIRKERTYKDFEEYISSHPDASIVEMDTVEGVKGGKVFLTLLFRKTKLMLIFIMEAKTMECVNEVLDGIKIKLGLELFSKLFEVILTDNGSEFFDPISIETNYETGEILSHIFYCNPGASYQKGALEKNHEFIRYILPKGNTFDLLDQKDCELLMSNINSIHRVSLNNNCPSDLSITILNKKILEKFNIQKIEPDKVNLSRKLLTKTK